MAYFFACLDRNSIISNGGDIIENADGTVSVFYLSGSTLVLQPMTKPCCEVLDSSYVFDIDNQVCRWNAGCDNPNPFKVVLNPNGNDGVIFGVDNFNNESCTLDISFDFLLQLNCADIVTKLTDVSLNSGLDPQTLAQINALQISYDECVATVAKLQSDLDSAVIQLESTPFVILCDNKEETATSSPTSPQVFEKTAPADDQLPVNFRPPNALLPFGLNVLCLTEAGLQQWEIILGVNRYEAWLNSSGTDTTQYSCTDVNALDALDNGTGNLFGSCQVRITARQEIEATISNLTSSIARYDCEAILAQIDALKGEAPCSSVTEILESFNVSMTLELVNQDTNELETIYEESIFNIGSGNLPTYLNDTIPNTGLLLTGESTSNDCEITAKKLMDELGLLLPTSAVTEVQTLVEKSFDSEWLNISTSITDQPILDLIYNEKIKISFKINDCCIDFAILVDRIKLNRNCTKLKSTEVLISKSPSFDMIRIRDNKKSWLANEDFKNREFDLKFRDTQYDINNYKLAINSKEVDLDINPANAIEQDVYCYVKDNLCLLTGTTEVTGVTCGDNGINLNDILTTDASLISSSDEFRDVMTTELINVKGWKTMSAYPTLRLLYDRYMNSTAYCDTISSQFVYSDMITFSELVGTYWVDLIEQVIPSTTIWGSTYVYGNTIFDQQKFKYKKSSLFICETPTYNGDVVSPTSGWTNDVQVEWTILPNDNTETGTTTTATTITLGPVTASTLTTSTGSSLTTSTSPSLSTSSQNEPPVQAESPYANISYQKYTTKGQEAAPKPPTCNGVGIIQINCGSEFIGTIVSLNESSNNGTGVLVISECSISADISSIEYGASGYSATAYASGDVVGPLSYYWSNGETTQTALNLVYGIQYTVTITDDGSQDCSATNQIILNPLEIR